MYKADNIKFINEHFLGRWFGRPSLFVNALVAMSVFIPIIILVIASFFPRLFGLPADEFSYPWEIPAFLTYILENQVQNSLYGYIGLYSGYVFVLIVVPLVAIFLSFSIIVLAKAFGELIGMTASRWMDRVTWKQIRKSAFGDDAPGTHVTSAQETPMWTPNSFDALPAPLSDDIAKFSDRAAGDSLEKFRDATWELAFTDRAESKSDVVFGLPHMEGAYPHGIFFASALQETCSLRHRPIRGISSDRQFRERPGLWPSCQVV
jgi:hypothetical protein